MLYKKEWNQSRPAEKLELASNCPPLQPFFCKASVEVSIEVVFITKLVRQRDAGEKLTPLALDGVNIEENDETGEDAQEKSKCH